MVANLTQRFQIGLFCGFLKYFFFCFIFYFIFSNFTSHKAITFWWPECEGRKEGNVLFNDALNTFY